MFDRTLLQRSIFLRVLLNATLAWSLTLAVKATAQAPSTQTEDTTQVDTALGIATIPLWDGVAPGPTSANPPSSPTLTVFMPAQGKSNGTAVIVAPGGSYSRVVSNLEGRQAADWFTVRGITAFVLKYRLGKDNIFPIPLLDAQQAIRLVRSLAPKYGISPNRIGMMGFSAGGHLTAAAGTLFHNADPNTSSLARFSDRPDFLVLAYPWLNAMQPNDRKLITYCSVLQVISPADCQAFEKQYTPAMHVTANTPPTFLYITSDDKTVLVQASVDFYSALNSVGVPAELHIFRHGVHGSGMGLGDATLDEWPTLLEHWLRDQHLLDSEKP